MSIQTLNELFLHTIRAHPKPDLLLHKVAGRYVPIATSEVAEAVERFALGLRGLGVERGDHVALLSENRPGWLISDYAILGLGAVNVPIYPTLTAKQVEYILQDSQARILIVSTEKQWEKVRSMLDALPLLKKIVTLDPVVTNDARVTTYEALCENGRAFKSSDPEFFFRRAQEAKAGDLASLIYTSGTSGNPRGVMLSHANLVSNVLSTEHFVEINERDVALSFLPLSHVYERMLDYLLFYRGATIAYAESMETVAQNLMEVRPTLAACVPRFFEKLYARIGEAAATASPLRQKVFRWAQQVARDWAKRSLAQQAIPWWLALQYRVADRMVFSKIRERIGGRMRFFLSGSAPLAPELAEFFFSVGILVMEGYGLTESSPVISVNRLEKFKIGTVGVPIPGVDVRIADDGEILVRGPNVMMGYYHRPEETAAALADGWLHTGDIGVIDEDGFLKITDRKKDIIVTSGGKNVAPQNIENLLKTNPFIANAIVVGNRRHFCVALVVPHFEKLEAWARQNQIAFQSRSELVQHPTVVKWMWQQVEWATTDLASFERIKKMALLDEDFTIESGELTPTMKVRRRIVEQRYQGLIDQLYTPAKE